MTPKEALRKIKYFDGNMSREQNQRYYELEKVLTPPTEDEVCKALSDYLEKEVKYIGHSFMLLDGFEVVDTNLDDMDGNYLPRINLQLPPYLITLIGRFYEGKIKRNYG